MKPGFICECQNQRAVKAVDAHTFTKQAEVWKNVVYKKADGSCFHGQERSADGLIRAAMDHDNVRSVLRNKKKLLTAIQKKKRGMLASSVMLLYDNVCVRIQLLALEHCWSISTGSCLTTLFTALISLQATATCIPT
jgi:hypothetical protein